MSLTCNVQRYTLASECFTVLGHIDTEQDNEVALASAINVDEMLLSE
jgi:hypothetical protein